jgi:hypothetical protein
MRVGGSAARPGRLYPRERPGTHCTEAGLAPGPVWTGGKFRLHRDSIPDRPARSSVAIPTELPGPPKLIFTFRNFITAPKSRLVVFLTNNEAWLRREQLQQR